MQEVQRSTWYCVVLCSTRMRHHPDIVSSLRASGQLPVTYDQGEAAARRFGSSCYLETSPQVEKDIRKLINSAIGSVLTSSGDGAQQPVCSVL
ncbi:rho-related GTP-binding protein RhoF [Elysia marginata]|uniref:Rho-related GTP-binding protein RhoF n=1 Tax=Elysia marginata TaxID=1093978 RepID=A0AAV4GCW4_9GAST|nr:rho-related GTP-binding protein RhoF [Elysia marginata]